MELEMFKEILLPLRPQLLQVAVNMLLDEDDAEDAVQEAYIKLWTVRMRLSSHPNVQGYAMQTLKNTCVDRIRSRKNDLKLDNISIESSARNPHAELEINNEVQYVKSLIDALPMLQRNIMNMRDIEGYELDEIAQIIGADITAIRVNLSRARKKIREQLIEVYKIRR